MGSKSGRPAVEDMAGNTQEDQVAATLGFVIAVFAFAVAFLEWSPVVAAYGIPSIPGALTASVSLIVLLLRRYGLLDRSAAFIAVLGFSGVILSAVVALTLPAIRGNMNTAVGIGVYLALLVGTVGVGMAFSDARGFGSAAVFSRVRWGLVACGLGVGGLFFGVLLSTAVAGLLGPVLPEVARSSLVTVVFSLGLGIVAVGFAVQRPARLGYFDVRMPDTREWIYVVGGLIGMFGVLIAGGVVSSLLGLPSATHGFMQQAQTKPEILLPLIPLSILAIGPSEELLNRNVVQKILYGTYSRTGAVLLATLIFTVIHVPAYGGGTTPAALFVTLLRLFLVSLVLSVVYERTENVVVAALVHGGFNAIQFGAAYLIITTGSLSPIG